MSAHGGTNRYLFPCHRDMSRRTADFFFSASFLSRRCEFCSRKGKRSQILNLTFFATCVSFVSRWDSTEMTRECRLVARGAKSAPSPGLRVAIGSIGVLIGQRRKKKDRHLKRAKEKGRVKPLLARQDRFFFIITLTRTTMTSVLVRVFDGRAPSPSLFGIGCADPRATLAHTRSSIASAYSRMHPDRPPLSFKPDGPYVLTDRRGRILDADRKVRRPLSVSLSLHHGKRGPTGESGERRKKKVTDI